MAKNKLVSHIHDWQYPVPEPNTLSYLVKCSGCSAYVRITKRQFEQGGYKK